MAEASEVRRERRVVGLFDVVSAALWRFLQKGRYVDIVVELQDGQYGCHQVVLAALSPVFDAMLSDDMREHREGLIRLPSVNLSTWKAIMGFYYAGDQTINEVNVEELLDVSEMIQLDSLKEGCVDFLRSTISPENCLYYLQMADKYDLQELKVRAYHYVMTQFTKVWQESDFLQLCEADILALLRSTQLNVASEEVISDAVLHWLEGTSATTEQATRMFAEVRLCRLSTEYLQQRILTHVYVKDNPVSCGLVHKELSQRPPYDRSKIPVMPCVRRGKPCHREDVIYVAGVDTDRQFALYVWSVAKRVWIRLPDPCHCQGGQFATVVSDNVLYLTGGSLKPHMSLAFDPVRKCWLHVSHLVEGRQEHGMAAVGGRLYVFGGYALGKGALASIECLTPRPGGTACQETLDKERKEAEEKRHVDKKGRRMRKRGKDRKKEEHAGAAMEGVGYVGQVGAHAEGRCPGGQMEGEWQPAGQLILGVWDCGVAVLQDTVFIMGGDHTNGGVFADRYDIIQTFDTRTHTCSVLHLHLPCPMRHARCVTTDSKDAIFVLGSCGDLVTLTFNPEYYLGSDNPPRSTNHAEMKAAVCSRNSASRRSMQSNLDGITLVEKLRQAASCEDMEPCEAGASGDASRPELGGTSCYIDLTAEGSVDTSSNAEDDLPFGAEAKMFACRKNVGSGAFEEPSNFLKSLKEIFPDPPSPRTPSLHGSSYISSDEDFSASRPRRKAVTKMGSDSSLSSGDVASFEDPVMVRTKVHIEALEKLATHDVLQEGDCLTVFASQSRVDVNLVAAFCESGTDSPTWDREIPPPPIRLSIHGVGKFCLPWKYMV